MRLALVQFMARSVQVTSIFSVVLYGSSDVCRSSVSYCVDIVLLNVQHRLKEIQDYQRLRVKRAAVNISCN